MLDGSLNRTPQDTNINSCSGAIQSLKNAISHIQNMSDVSTTQARNIVSLTNEIESLTRSKINLNVEQAAVRSPQQLNG